MAKKTNKRSNTNKQQITSKQKQKQNKQTIKYAKL